MAILDLTGQQELRDTIAPRIQNLRTAMGLRKALWDKMPTKKKKAWIASGRDPIMTLAWQIYKYLHDNFFGEEINDV